jgi:hypothetical protein
MRASASVWLAALLLAGCSSNGSSQTHFCPERPVAMEIRVDISEVSAGTVLRLCANRPSSCSITRVTESDHPPFAFVGYSYPGTSTAAVIQLTLRATRAGHTYSDSVLLHIPQDQIASCGNYGGIGRAVVNNQLQLTSERAPQ